LIFQVEKLISNKIKIVTAKVDVNALQRCERSAGTGARKSAKTCPKRSISAFNNAWDQYANPRSAEETPPERRPPTKSLGQR
jgi:hypothetical protein